MIGEAADITAAVVTALKADGYTVRQVLPGRRVCRLRADRCEADLSAPESVRALHHLLTRPESAPVGGLINFLGMSQTFGSTDGEETEATMAIAEGTFNLVKEFVEDLQVSARTGGGWFVNVTALGGQFGLDRRAMPSVVAAGTLGITKTLHREYPHLAVKNIDVDANIPADVLAARLIQEMAAEDDLMEVGLTKQGRCRPALKREPAPSNLPPLPIDREAVILVTGGAYGVTADVAKKLATCAKPRLILVGRSSLPEAESTRTRDLDKTALRAFFLHETRASGGQVLPAVIERTVNRVLKDRQIRGNLEACAAAGARVEYHSLDVRDGEQFGQLIDNLYERFGRIDGVIHGAGIIEDKHIPDKTLDSFANVFRTKVDSAFILGRKLRPETLKFLVFFGSVSGRFGNAGQVDYSAANEVLNKLAGQLSHRWPGRVVCINWGPWDGGMVTDDLRGMYARAGLELIPVEEGVASFLSEIRLTNRSGAEVVIGCGVERMSREDRKRSPAKEMAIANC